MIEFSASGRNGSWSFAKDEREILLQLKYDALTFLFTFCEEAILLRLSCFFPSAIHGAAPPQVREVKRFFKGFGTFDSPV